MSRVLIVEDEIDNRNVLAAVLRHCGAEVECAGTLPIRRDEADEEAAKEQGDLAPPGP